MAHNPHRSGRPSISAERTQQLRVELGIFRETAINIVADVVVPSDLENDPRAELVDALD
jgi:hypothetical protein